MHAKSSQGTFHGDKRRSTDYGRKASKDFLALYSLPEHAAQRWLNQSKYQSGEGNKVLFGGKYTDTKSKLVPEERRFTNNFIDPDAEEKPETERNKTVDTQTSKRQSEMKQEKELKRIMQSQKSLKNATQSIVKLKKVHEHTQTWSLLDHNFHASGQGSAQHLGARVVTSDPQMFRSQST